MQDKWNLQRFVDAQAPVYETALAELRDGRKRTHWMWFVFPQVAGLGHSPMAQRYAISGQDEAKAYLTHPLLGSRLEECTEAVKIHTGRSAREIFGAPDDMKFRSCLTLFAHAGPGNALFRETLTQFYAGDDPATLDRLSIAP
ncbi:MULTISPECIES: DUF1810 domain-containing protein [unclassified Rhizobium]|uniref:DUF1810 domain-containing protein n=1 Tax=unclassified Rhizobium TaxID=2613769 RepID=UPI0006F8AD8B|nr:MULTISPECIES: DUF1810 domain-containing protein [unclassified Rhizobium]KQV44160.1 calpastatin [Rhizobium sp. Root1212]KRD38341.1 calpastatin [Rhizobium sp. Root268]